MRQRDTSLYGLGTRLDAHTVFERTSNPLQRLAAPPAGMVQALSVNQAWAVLSVAILFEVAGTTCMRLSESFTKLVPSILIFVFYAISFVFNTLVTRTLGLSVVYAVWSGVGTVLTALIGFLYFKEPATALKMVSAGLIVIGVCGLHAASRATA